jgi:hypothetical protein
VTGTIGQRGLKMKKTLIILVHGMGTHAKGEMTKSFTKGLTDYATGLGVDIGGAITSTDYAEFNYSEYFDAIRKQFAENAEARQKGFGFLSGKGFELTLLTQLTNFESKMDKDEFFYTHWLDVILYSTSYFGEKIRLDFVTFFDELRRKYNHKNIHIVCHSLGTAIVHDSLAKYYRIDSDPFDNIPDLKTGNFNIASLWTLANVSRMVNLLNHLGDPMSSTVCTGLQGCTRNFMNVRHEYDPFTWFKQYDRQMKDGVEFINSTIRQINTHDFYEYVCDPSVARSMLRVFFKVTATDQQHSNYIKEYNKNTLKKEADTLKELIDGVRKDPSIDSIKAAITQYKKIQAEISKFTSLNEQES